MRGKHDSVVQRSYSRRESPLVHPGYLPASHRLHETGLFTRAQAASFSLISLTAIGGNRSTQAGDKQFATTAALSEFIRQNCPAALAAYKASGALLYRGEPTEQPSVLLRPPDLFDPCKSVTK
jgi:hypothetical protein